MSCFEEGIRLFNEGHYKEAHEEWEALWITLPASPRKNFLHGLIMTAAALYKYGKNEFPGMEKLLKKGFFLIKENVPEDSGMDVEMFLSETESFWKKYLSGREDPEGSDMPRISTRRAGQMAKG